MHSKVEQVRSKVDGALDEALKKLARYVAVPAISSDPKHKEDVKRLGTMIRDDLTTLGFKRSRLLELDDAHPCVAAEWLKADPSKPTILIYGHFDVQPVAGENWNTPPHELVRKGDRAYGRGSADDMGGWVSHLVTLEAWLQEAGELPCNVKLLIEGEEEIGSPNLERYMDAFPDAFESDVMVLTDCENPAVDLPGLTISLRGLLEIELAIQTAECDVHSGLWGNVVPDPAILLVKLIARLVDDEGRMKIGRRPVDPKWMEGSKSIPMNDETIRSGAHLLPGVSPLESRDMTAPAWAWRQPAVTILSSTFPAPGTEKNAVRHRSSVKLSFRVAPGQTREELFDLVNKELDSGLPKGVKLEISELGGGASSWDYEPKGPAFDAADRAYVKAWGRPMVRTGIGGSIPFVALFGKRFSNLPLILNGVIDPETTAHGPNESLHLGVFQKAMIANVYLLDELSALKK